MGEAIKTTLVADEIVSPVAPTGFRGFLAKFTVLKGAQRNLWLTFLIKFLIYTAYSVTNKTMVLWLSKDLGFSDQAAGALVGWVWAPAMTVFTLLAGSLTDAIGLRRTFFLGVAICTIARSVMVVTTIPSLALACGVLPLAVGEALGTPVLLAATRRYSTTAQRSISFSIIYMIMNIGYIAAGYIFDYVRQLNLHVSLFGFEPSSYQQLFVVSLAFEIVLFPVIYFLRRDADTQKQGRRIDAITTPRSWRRIGQTVRQSAIDTAHLFRRLDWSIRFLPAARLLPLHRISQSHLFADGLRVSEVRHSRTRLQCARGKAFSNQRDRHYYPGADRRRADAKVCSVSNGRDRRSDLCRRSIHHGAADAMVPARHR